MNKTSRFKLRKKNNSLNYHLERFFFILKNKIITGYMNSIIIIKQIEIIDIQLFDFSSSFRERTIISEVKKLYDPAINDLASFEPKLIVGCE